MTFPFAFDRHPGEGGPLLIVIPAKAGPLLIVIPAKAGPLLIVIPAKAGTQARAFGQSADGSQTSPSFQRKLESILTLPFATLSLIVIRAKAGIQAVTLSAW